MKERGGDVTLDGMPLTVLGEKLQVGDQAPDFQLMAPDFSRVTLADSAGRVRLLSVVPAIYTPVCSTQTRRFEQEAAALDENVVVYTISVDLPPTLAHWCEEEGCEHIRVLSDHPAMSFANAYGTHVKEIRQEQRAVFVVDAEGVIRYIEYVPEIGQEPDYEAALEAVREASGKGI